MKVTVTEPTVARTIVVEVLEPAPSGLPADMRFGQAVVNGPAGDDVTRLVTRTRPAERIQKVTAPDGTVTETPVTVDEVYDAHEDELVPWPTVCTIPLEAPVDLEPGTYDVTIVDVDVVEIPEHTVDAPNPEWHPEPVVPVVDLAAEADHLETLARFEAARRAVAAGRAAVAPDATVLSDDVLAAVADLEPPLSPYEQAMAAYDDAEPGSGPDVAQTVPVTIPAVVAPQRQRATLTRSPADG